MRVRRRASIVAVDFDEGAFALAHGIGDAVERRFNERSARGAAGREIGSELRERGPWGGRGHGHASFLQR